MAKNTKTQPIDTLKVRLDKWLWAARFYKTRAIARDMIQGGKVQYNSQRCKPSKTVEIGAIIKLTQNHDEKVLTILEISEHRRGAPEAQLLYEESDESIKQREINVIARKNNSFFSPHPERKPDKKQRRKIIQFKQN